MNRQPHKLAAAAAEVKHSAAGETPALPVKT